jgi:DNA-binding GntR family transcriptional regulator
MIFDILSFVNAITGWIPPMAGGTLGTAPAVLADRYWILSRRRTRGTPMTSRPAAIPRKRASGSVRMARRPQLSEEVAAHLRDLIMSGEVRAGEFIRLEDIAEQLGVSITPVREALLTLRGEDMVELEPRRGYVVTPLSRQDIADLFRLQGDIAGELAARAATKITPAELDELGQLQGELTEAVAAGRVHDVEEFEFDFHRIINRAANARKLSWFLHTATRYTPVRFYSSDEGWRSTMLADHRALLDALAAQDLDAVRSRMAHHFTDGAERLTRHLDALGVWGDSATGA